MGRTPQGETRERVYRFLLEQLVAGFSPTVREVQKAFGFRAVQTAHEHLQRLVEEGRLEQEAGCARGYRLPIGNAGSRWVSRLVPVLGRVQAGELMTAVEDLVGYVPVQARNGGESDLFGLRVHGESMTGVGILPQDLVIVRTQPSARSGEIVVALVGDEATVKVLKKQGRRVELHPRNPDFSPIVPDPRDFRLLGKVIEVRRYLEPPPVLVT